MEINMYEVITYIQFMSFCDFQNGMVMLACGISIHICNLIYGDCAHLCYA